jgi:transposase
MVNRSKGEKDRERDSVEEALANASEEVKQQTGVEKASYLLSLGFSIASISEVLGLHRSKVQRVRDAINRGATPGKNGHPQYLTEAQENDLENWIRQENHAGRGPTIPSVCERVCLYFSIKIISYYVLSLTILQRHTF